VRGGAALIHGFYRIAKLQLPRGSDRKCAHRSSSCYELAPMIDRLHINLRLSGIPPSIMAHDFPPLKNNLILRAARGMCLPADPLQLARPALPLTRRNSHRPRCGTYSRLDHEAGYVLWCPADVHSNLSRLIE
jgi:hypothetical protein